MNNKKFEEQVLRMYKALRKISKEYQTPDQLRRSCKSKQGYMGLDAGEAIEMAYENIQNEAANAIRGVSINGLIKTLNKEPKLKRSVATEDAQGTEPSLQNQKS